ncbi:MAG: hypothetical protein FJ087_20285, partial [Deltaproteobacteria bacterium]|nr:hypothetical protein [Deltaproteobacteria bacterium]
MNGTAHDEAGPDRRPAPYHDAGEHLFEHMVLLRLFLQRHLVLFTDRYLDSKGRETDAFASRREVEAFLGMEPPGPDAAAQVAAP